jgi:transposase-like protein
MATKEKYQSHYSSKRIYRYFSEEFKKKIVKDLERNLVTISEVSKEYEVSKTAIYNWLYQYSALKKKGMRQVIESKSLTRKLQSSKEEIKELKSIIGEKQILIEFQEKLIELAEQHYKIDIKKNFGDKLSSGSGITGKVTDTK